MKVQDLKGYLSGLADDLDVYLVVGSASDLPAYSPLPLSHVAVTLGIESSLYVPDSSDKKTVLLMGVVFPK